MGLNNPVGFPTAKLLKVKGFEQNPMKYINQATMEGTLVFPTIADVVMWLYKKYGIWITVTSISQESWQCHMTKKGDSLGKCYLEDFYNPTEAYEAAINYTLNNLI